MLKEHKMYDFNVLFHFILILFLCRNCITQSDQEFCVFFQGGRPVRPPVRPGRGKYF